MFFLQLFLTMLLALVAGPVSPAFAELTVPAPEPVPIATGDRFAKLQAVLRELGISEERSYADDLSFWEGMQTRQGFETILKYLDPAGTLGRYSSWGDYGLVVYQDRDTKQIVDLTLKFKLRGKPRDPKGLLQALRSAATNTDALPLAGVRVALDPGHMGGEEWDLKSGKYVQLPDSGALVSEGTLAFQTCLLLMDDLRRLGAEVLITRRQLGPVTRQNDTSFNLLPFAHEEIRASSDKFWFDDLLTAHGMGDSLLKAFRENTQVQALGGEEKRYLYFNNRLDLSARAKLINEFRPHLTLMVHFDARNSNELQNHESTVRAYVPGNVLADELATREQRAVMVRTLFDGHRWVQSNLFSASLVKNLAVTTGVPLKTDPTDFGGIRIEDGIYARNLALTRLVAEGATSYVEVLNYDYASEFPRLATRDKFVTIDGIDLIYPSRLHDIVDGLKNGILEYIRTFRGKPTE